MMFYRPIHLSTQSDIAKNKPRRKETSYQMDYVMMPVWHFVAHDTFEQ